MFELMVLEVSVPDFLALLLWVYGGTTHHIGNSLHKKSAHFTVGGEKERKQLASNVPLRV